jgi:hypothetical protein
MAGLVDGLLEREIGIVQMPCPELCAYGLERAEVDVEKDLRSPAGKELCRRLAREQVHHIKAYLDGGIRVLGVLGKNGSPSCGVEETWNGGVCPGRGAFIEELAAEIQAAGLAIEITGVRDREPDRALAVVDRWLDGTARCDCSAPGSALLLVALLSLPVIPSAADARASPRTIVDFHTLCSDCHEGQCSGHLSFDSGSAAARSHIERYLGSTDEATVAALFAMLRHVKENCSHYPVVPLRPATGTWEADELSPWRNARAGAYFIPLGQLDPGRRQIVLEFDRPAEGIARVDDDRMETVADEQLCRDLSKVVELEVAATTAYFLHLKSGAAILSRIRFH